ncbi:hypothetical protein BA78_7915 [Aspergillus fumigatus]|nr:hypothetical protein BA78_7915 [Aspergillus fumigatus]
MHYSQFVTVASALALAPTAVVARQGAAAFVTVNSIDVCPKKVAQEIINPGPKVVTTPYTCDQVKLGHGLDVSYYNFDIEPLTKDTFTARLSRSLTTKLDCREDAPVKKEPYGPKEGAEQFAPQAEHSTKQDAQQGSHQGQEVQNSPKQEARQGSRPAEAAPKQEQEAEQASEAAPEKKASNPADSLGLGELTKVLGFR